MRKGEDAEGERPPSDYLEKSTFELWRKNLIVPRNEKWGLEGKSIKRGAPLGSFSSTKSAAQWEEIRAYGPWITEYLDAQRLTSLSEDHY